MSLILKNVETDLTCPVTLFATEDWNSDGSVELGFNPTEPASIAIVGVALAVNHTHLLTTTYSFRLIAETTRSEPKVPTSSHLYLTDVEAGTNSNSHVSVIAIFPTNARSSIQSGSIRYLSLSMRQD